MWKIFRIFKRKRRYDGPEKRSHFRVIYPPSQRPWLVVNDSAFEVADISQRGLRFLNRHDIRFEPPIEGTVRFTDGESVEVTGQIGWKKADAVSLLLAQSLPPDIIRKEWGRGGL